MEDVRLLVDNRVGTLGCIVTKKKLLTKQYFILSTNSVLTNGNYNTIGTPIVQDTIGSYIKSKKNIVAHLSNFIPIEYVEYNLRHANFVDCAIAKITNSSYVNKKIFGIGTPKGVAVPILGETVKKLDTLVE